VESVTPDMAAGKVVVTGPADAVQLKERIEARAKKPVQIVSAGAGSPKKDKEKKADGGEKNAAKEKGGGDAEKKKADKKKGGGDGGEKNADKKKGGGGGDKKADKEKGTGKPKEEEEEEEKPKEPKEVSDLYLPIIIQVPCGGDPRRRLPPCPWSATGRHALVSVPGDGYAQDPTALRRLHGPHQAPHLQDQRWGFRSLAPRFCSPHRPPTRITKAQPKDSVPFRRGLGEYLI
jgi:hypothetical protein